MMALKRWLVVLVLLWAGAGVEAQVTCTVCNRSLEEGQPYATGIDQVEFKERIVCPTCAKIPELCFLCALPAKDGRKTLSDGRYYCARDAQTALFGSLEIEKICRETVARLERPFSRFLLFPTMGVTWAVEDIKQRTAGLEAGPKRCGHAALRYTIRDDGQTGGRTYGLILLNGLPRPWIMSAAVHGITHVWLSEHVPPGRRMTTATVEAFCEFMTWSAMEALGEEAEADRLWRAHEANSEFQMFIEGRRLYDLYRLLEWMQYGADDRLVAGDDDRFRRLNPNLRQLPAAPRQVIPPAPAPVRAPEKLVLRGILGSGSGRLALINDATLAAGETGRVHLGTRTVRIHCLEIKADRVVVQLEDEAEQELLLPADPNGE